MLICLFTLAVILFIYGLYYEIVQEDLVIYTKDISEYIEFENVKFF